MATATKSVPRDLNGAAEQVTQLNDRLLDAGKQFGNLYLDGYEKAVASMTDAQKKLAEQSQVAVMQSLIEAQADLTGELTKTYTTAARAALA
jgi:hypothetical protein